MSVESLEVFNRMIQAEIEYWDRLADRKDIALDLAQMKLLINREFVRLSPRLDPPEPFDSL